MFITESMRILAASAAFLISSALCSSGSVGACTTSNPASRAILKRSAKLSIADRFKMARDAGFEVVQAPTEPDEHKAEEIKKAAEAANIRIDSVMNMDHWQYPLSSNDPAVVEKSLAGMRTSLHSAKFWGADAVLLVPAVVNPQMSTVTLGRVRKRKSARC